MDVKTLKWMIVLALGAGCAVDVPAEEDEDESQLLVGDAGAPADENLEELDKASLVSAALTRRRGSCSTADFETLSRQLARHQACMYPGQFVEVSDSNVRAASGTVQLFMVAESARRLREAARGGAITINSAFRSVADQLALQKRGGCAAVARPGSSNHQGGRAIDVANYSAVRGRLQNNGFTWLGDSDRVHFTGPGPDNRSRAVRAFQNIWNLNHPEDRIAEDGAWGPATERRLMNTPMGGFSRTACTAQAAN